MRGRDPPLVGRTTEVEQLAQAARRTLAGSGCVVVIEGEAGIGKTRLVNEALLRVRSPVLSVCVGTAVELERHRPFGPVVDALGIRPTASDPHRATVAAQLAGSPINAVDYTSAEAPDAYRVSEAIVALVERLCTHDPLLLVIEDLHWADPATSLCLARLASLCGQLPVMLVTSLRPWPRNASVTALLHALEGNDAMRLPLEPLTDDELPELATGLLGTRPGRNLREQLRRVGGNPLLASELLRALEDTGALAPRSDGSLDVDEVADPVAPPLTILHRLGLLPLDVVEVLRLAAVLGTSFSVRDLSMLSGKSAAELAPPLQAALERGTLEEVGDRIAFRHGLIQQALYNDLPAALRQALHMDVAAALVADGRPAAMAAEHLLRGAAPGDRAAVVGLHRAATEVAGRAPAVAVELLDRALELVDPLDPLAGRIGADRAMALIWSGEHVAGEEAGRKVLADHPDLEHGGELKLTLIRSMLTRGDAAAALEQLDATAALTGLSDALQARVTAAASFAGLLMGTLDGATARADEAVRAAEATGDPLALCEALRAAATARHTRGEVVTGMQLALRAVEAVDDGLLVTRAQNATAVAGYLLILNDRVEEAKAMFHRGRVLHEQLGARGGLAAHSSGLAMGLVLTGEWDDAITELESTRGLVGEGLAWPVTSLGVLALIAAQRDDIAAAESYLASADAALAHGAPTPHRIENVTLARVIVLDAAGESEQALATLDGLWDQLAEIGASVAYPQLGPELIRRLVDVGHHSQAELVAEAVERCAAINPGVNSIAGIALVCRGLVSGDPELLLAGVATLRTAPRPLDRALACEDAAAVLRAADRGTDARALLEEAAAVYADLRAARGAARVAAGLRTLGVHQGVRGRRQRPATGWDALTDTERKVVALLAERLSNPEIAERMFISRRTVETHVSHALTKTDLRSRVDLGREARRRGLLGTGQGVGEDRQ